VIKRITGSLANLQIDSAAVLLPLKVGWLVGWRLYACKNTRERSEQVKTKNSQPTSLYPYIPVVAWLLKAGCAASF
jgi:hypothetical protein